MTRPIVVVALLALAAACDRGSSPSEPAAPEPTAPPAEATAPADVGVPCVLAAGEVGIQGTQLTAADGSCRLFLPSQIVVGELQVHVSAVGDDSAAAIEAVTPDGPLYATTGTVTVTSVDGGRVAGRIEAEDSADPVVGRISTTFDVALAGP